jgi:uracil phosphoribosyltransferase
MQFNLINSLEQSNSMINCPDKKLFGMFKDFIQPNCQRIVAQETVMNLTLLLMQKFFKSDTPNVLLIPVLRAGMAMWTSANHYFNYPESLFITCRKNKGTNKVISSISMSLSVVIEPKNIIIFDTVAATGDTLCHLVKELAKYTNSKHQVHIATCFISPEALNNLRINSSVDSISTVFLMEGVRPDGYLIPYLGGDVGDKLYGRQL